MISTFLLDPHAKVLAPAPPAPQAIEASKRRNRRKGPCNARLLLVEDLWTYAMVLSVARLWNEQLSHWSMRLVLHLQGKILLVDRSMQTPDPVQYRIVRVSEPLHHIKRSAEPWIVFRVQDKPKALQIARPTLISDVTIKQLSFVKENRRLFALSVLDLVMTLIVDIQDWAPCIRSRWIFEQRLRNDMLSVAAVLRSPARSQQ
ncbi:MAG: hypothetical protein IH889_04850 [Planctomycetes bacterium]|nr:hypothetical protein [Planctomycetota bacterium]